MYIFSLSKLYFKSVLELFSIFHTYLLTRQQNSCLVKLVKTPSKKYAANSDNENPNKVSKVNFILSLLMCLQLILYFEGFFEIFHCKNIL